MENNLSLGAAWMNGKVLPIAQATIPVNDWGLVHSDITYDVVPVIDGAFLDLMNTWLVFILLWKISISTLE